MNILVTGSSGFIGKALVNNLSKNKNLNIYCGVRSFNNKMKIKNLTQVFLGDFSKVVNKSLKIHNSISKT